jgi:hypothetical protein
MFKWLCLACALVFAGFMSWVALDIRSEIKRTLANTDRTLVESRESMAIIRRDLPQIVEGARKSADTLSVLSEDVKTVKKLGGLTTITSDGGFTAYAEEVITLIEKAPAETKIGTARTSGGKTTLKDPVSAKEWSVGARKEALLLVATAKSREAILHKLVPNVWGTPWYIEVPGEEAVSLESWIKSRHPASAALKSGK